MKLLYIDCGMGAAGDMLTAALLELAPDRDRILRQLNELGLPGVTVAAEPSVKCGITGTHITVKVGELEEDEHLHEHEHHHHDHEHHDHHHEHEHSYHHDHHHHEHEHAHEHTHDHHHSGMHEIAHIVSHLHVPEAVKQDVLAVYELIAQAESHVHGVPVPEIHFHEVGTMDAVADITAVCLLMHELQPDKVIASPVHVGSGSVRCAHGILPVPAPATAHILQGIPIYGGSIRGELCTPTGAALLKHFVTEFADMPPMMLQGVGYGMGKKDFERANCVRVLLGETAETAQQIVELRCNVDDMTGEAIGFALERLLEQGALEAFTVPVGMKKSRPGIMLCVLCRPAQKEQLVQALFRHTTTLGIREQLCSRYTLERSLETVDTPFGTIRRKVSHGYGVTRTKYEYDDLANIARTQNSSLSDVLEAIEK